MSTDHPTPPRALTGFRDAAEQQGWEVTVRQTTGAGTHPSRGYVSAHFADLAAVRGDVRIDVSWIAERQPLDAPGWTPAGIVGRWALARPALSTLRGTVPPERFRQGGVWLGRKAGAGPTVRLASLRDALRLLGTDPDSTADYLT